MNKNFKARLLFRAVTWLGVGISGVSLFLNPLDDILFFIFFGFLAIVINKIEYILNDESLTIKGLFEKDAIYPFSDFKRIQEEKSIIPFIRIFLVSRKRPLILLNDDIEEFVTIILKATEGKKNIVFDESGKGIDFEAL